MASKCIYNCVCALLLYGTITILNGFYLLFHFFVLHEPNEKMKSNQNESQRKLQSNRIPNNFRISINALCIFYVFNLTIYISLCLRSQSQYKNAAQSDGKTIAN